MSSRLLTMKFMQRAAASAPSSPATPDHKSAKRQKLADGSFSTPSSQTPSADDAIIQQSLADEEAKRLAAVEREAVKRGDTKWYLDIKPQQTSNGTPLRIVSAGFSELDAKQSHTVGDETDDEDASVQIGRRQFGKPPPPSEAKKDDDEDESTSSDQDNDQDEPPDRRQNGDTAELRAKLKAKRKADSAKNKDLADQRRSKQVKLNKLTSISGGGRAAPVMTCHRCGQKGHVKAQCTNVKQHSRKSTKPK